MKRAFTLIELLVVIAIIAILAAILFPVFAQAKEAAKKTVAISGIKQYATATGIYLSDSDDVQPLGFGSRPDGTWGYTVVHPYPTGWFDDPALWTLPGRIAMANSHPMNSTQPYVKNLQLSKVEGGASYQGAASDFSMPRKAAPGLAGLSYNGYLHGMGSSVVNQPAQVPMFTTSLGLANMEGRAITSPALNCNRPAVSPGVPATCQYGSSSVDGVNGGVWLFTGPAGTKAAAYSGGIVVSYTDGHAKFQKLSADGAGSKKNTNIREPWSEYIDGKPQSIRLCQKTQGAPYYGCFWMPDSEGTRETFYSIYE